MRDAIVGTGARLAFLPPCSPDLNPIEQVFAKVKHWMRMAEARCLGTIHDHVARLVRSVPSRECENYLRNAGYASA